MTTEVLEPVRRLSRDLVEAAATMTAEEARYLVDAYYIWQEDRKRTNNQVRALGEGAEPHSVIRWAADQADVLENQVKRALDRYTDSRVPGRWAKSIVGIGPIIAAGLLAHIDITKAPTVGHIWRFAGLDPTVTWDKHAKRPWNASLKTLCWKIGESFVKVSNRDDDVYGHVYQDRKLYEQARNERGELAEQAAAKLQRFKIGKDTEAYKAYSAGRLPPAHIHARAKRYATKLFLAHYFTVAYETEYGRPPPKPYVIEHLGHVNYIAPPNWPMI